MRECLWCNGNIPDTKRKHAKYCSTTCGNNFRGKKWESGNPEKVAEHKKVSNAKRRSKPFGRYQDHKSQAISRGVPFTITFEEWWTMWEPHWEDRGIGGLVMCRDGDQGGYELGNVRIDTQANNNREARGCALEAW